MHNSPIRPDVSLCFDEIYSQNRVRVFLATANFTELIKVWQIYIGDRGDTVVKVLCYKSGGRWFDSSWCYWNFSLT